MGLRDALGEQWKRTAKYGAVKWDRFDKVSFQLVWEMTKTKSEWCWYLDGWMVLSPQGESIYLEYPIEWLKEAIDELPPGRLEEHFEGWQEKYPRPILKEDSYRRMLDYLKCRSQKKN